MPPTQELAPVDPARLQAVADWVETRVRPVLHVVAETAQETDQPRQEFETRDYQIEAWAKLEMAREADRTRALGNLATGLGKTFVAAVDVMRYREGCAAQDPAMYPQILYVSHKHDINEQAAKTFAAIMPDAEIDFFKTQKKELPDADITFATIQSLYSELDRFDPQDFEYIVWDESHHLEAETFKTVRDYFDPLFEHAITATMERMDGKDIQDYFGEPLYQKTLPEGIAEGHLADIDYHIVFDKTIKEKLKEGFNPKSLKEIRDLFKDKPPIEEIARSIEEEIERLHLVNPKVIAFCESVEEAEALAATEFGGAAYHSGSTNRPQTLSDFRSGRLRRITTRDMFNEGVDIPDADLLVFLRGTGSPTIFEQQLGRGLRRAPGKEKLYVLDYVANIERIEKVRELSESILRRARQLGQPGATEEGGILGEGDDDRGLHIHTEHGDFDFDRMAVDLLEKWGVLRERKTPSRFSDLSNGELVDLALSLKPGDPLRVSDIIDLSKDKRFASLGLIYERFNSVKEFQKACGFEPTGTIRFSAKGMSDQDIIALALEIQPEAPLSNAMIKQLNRDGLFLNPATIYRRFGPMSEFQRACGFEPTEGKRFSARGLSNDDILALALRLHPGRPLTSVDISELSREGKFPDPTTIYNRFGDLSSFQRACGFDVANRKNEKTRAMSDNEVVALALQLHPGAPMSKKIRQAFASEGNFVSDENLRKRFGSIDEFYRACGFDVEAKVMMDNPYNGYSRDELIRLAETVKPGEPITSGEIQSLFEEGGFVSPGRIAKLFGSLAEFHRACGYETLDSKATRALSNQDVISLALQLSSKPLSSDQIKALSKEKKFIGYGAIKVRFGSIVEFHKACGFGEE